MAAAQSDKSATLRWSASTRGDQLSTNWPLPDASPRPRLSFGIVSKFTAPCGLLGSGRRFLLGLCAAGVNDSGALYSHREQGPSRFTVRKPRVVYRGFCFAGSFPGASGQHHALMIAFALEGVQRWSAFKR